MNTPWLEWRALASGILHWSPDAFWQATPHDLIAALKGRALLQSGLSTQTLAELRTVLKEDKNEL